MKTTYNSPQIEVIEIELEGVLCGSVVGDDNNNNGLLNFGNGGEA